MIQSNNSAVCFVFFIISLQVLEFSSKSFGHVTLADEEISVAIGGRTFFLWHIRLSRIFFFLPLNGMYMFILPLTLKECLFVVLYETVIALALILIDGAVAHLLKAAYIYLQGLYMCTNSNCFTAPVLGKLPAKLWEGKKYYSNVSTSPRTKSLCS